MSTIELNNAIAYINTYIKANNNNEITGVVMNNVLKDIVNKALNGLHFIGLCDSNTTFPINTPFAALAVGADTIEGVTIPSGCIAIVYNNGETGDTTQVEILVNVPALILAHNTNNTAHNDIRTTLQNLGDSLQAQIDALSASSDVVDIVADYTALQNYDTSGLSDNDIVKVLEDSTHDDATTYYRWVVVGGVGQWVYVGEQGAYYTKAEADARFAVAASLSALRTIVVGTTTCVTTTSGAVGLANGGNNKCVIVTDNELYIAHSGNKYEAINGDSEEYGNGGLLKENDATKFKVSKGTTSVEIEKDGDVNIDASGNDVNISADAMKLNGNNVVTANQIGEAGFTNDYEDLDNKPTIPAQGDYIEQLQQQLNKLFVVLSDGVPTLQRDQQGAIGILSNIGKLIFANYTALLQGSNVEINANQYVNILCGGPSQWKWGNNIRIEFDQSSGEYKFRIRKDGNTAPIVDISATGNSVMSFPANLQILAQAVGATMSLVSSGKLQIVNSSTGGIEIIKSNQSIKMNDDGSIDVIAGSGTVRVVGSNGVSIVGGSGGTAITGASLTFNTKNVATEDVVVPLNPATSDATTLVAGKLNTLGSVDYATIALPATPSTAEYNGTFTSTTSGDITVSLQLTFWKGDTDIVAGKTYSFSIQNGVGFIIQLD